MAQPYYNYTYPSTNTYTNTYSNTAYPQYHSSFAITTPTTSPQEEEMTEKEYIIGDGNTTSFTFPTTEKYPAVAVYDREVDGEGDEKQVTVTENKSAKVVIVQGETITVRFETAPAKRGAVILIG